MSGSQIAVLVGFTKGLEEVLSIVLASSHYTVFKTPTPSKAMKVLRAQRVDLVVASSRCSIASMVKLTESLGQPRKTRVIVLLAGHSPEAERRYREAGLQYVMHMPIHADDLLRAAQSAQ